MASDKVEDVDGSLGCLDRIDINETYIDYDAQGKQVIEYQEEKKNKLYDAFQANVIATPRTDEEVELATEACLEVVYYLKKRPSGVVLDGTKIHVPPSKLYREGIEFEKTKQVLGSGNSAGDIVIVKDSKKGVEHAQKTMMISVFREDEIRCWADMSDTGYVPSLYLFRRENNKVSIHMEILQKAITLRSIIDEEMSSIYEKDKSLLKPFSLYMLKGAIDAVSALHQKGWAHHDLHAGNLMLQHDTDNIENSLKVKILDFGLAKRFQGPLGLDFEGFRKDIGEVVRIFSALYTGEEFDNVRDVRKNWKSKLNEIAQHLSQEDKRELFCLVDGALKLVHPDDVSKYKSNVQKCFEREMRKDKDAMKKVVPILFPEEVEAKAKPLNVSDSVMPASDDTVTVENGEPQSQRNNNRDDDEPRSNRRVKDEPIQRIIQPTLHALLNKTPMEDYMTERYLPLRQQGIKVYDKKFIDSQQSVKREYYKFWNEECLRLYKSTPQQNIEDVVMASHGGAETKTISYMSKFLKYAPEMAGGGGRKEN